MAVLLLLVAFACPLVKRGVGSTWGCEDMHLVVGAPRNQMTNLRGNTS